MRSRPDARVVLGAALLVAVLACAVPAWAQDAEPGKAAPSREQIERALEVVKADPDLAAERTIRSLTWIDDEPDKPRKNTRLPAWASWIGELFMWLGQASRVLVWVVLAALAALLVLAIARMIVANRSQFSRGARFVAPTHVQDLDIRPESLPPDIGAAARALWDRDERRAALALLYRGLLSRLAHVHEVPIRDSSTEGDCMRLAARTLDTARIEYVTRLVRTWQRAIYGGMEPEAAEVHALCAGFASALDAPAGPVANSADDGVAGAPA